VPRIEVVLIDRKDLPSAGAGETGIVGLAPAVGNAIFAATGIPPSTCPWPRVAQCRENQTLLSGVERLATVHSGLASHE